MAQLSEDCFAFGGALLGVDAALGLIRERITPVVSEEEAPLAEACRMLTEVAGPVLWQQALSHKSVKRGKRPIADTRDKTMLHRIEMNVIDVPREIRFVAQRVLPVTPLPDAPFSLFCAAPRDRFAARQGARKGRFDEPPTQREIRVAIR